MQRCRAPGRRSHSRTTRAASSECGASEPVPRPNRDRRRSSRNRTAVARGGYQGITPRRLYSFSTSGFISRAAAKSARAATASPLRDRSTPRSHNVSDGCDVERHCRHPSSRLRTGPDGHGGRLRGVDVDAPLRSCRGPSDRADGPRSEWDQRPTTPPSSFVITMVADRGRDGAATAPLWLAGQLLVMFAGPPFSPGC